MAEKKGNKAFVWYSLRVSFWVMIALWILYILVDVDIYLGEASVLLALIWCISIFFTFVVSIIHLVNHDKKAFAIVALVFSSILGLLFVIGFAIGLLEGLAAGVAGS